MNRCLIIIIVGVFIIASCDKSRKISEKENQSQVNFTPLINYAATNYFPHDPSLFTEGLLFHKGQLYESTGSPDDLPESKSIIGITDLKTGKIDVKIELDKNIYFGEGIVILNNKIYQLTYKNQIGFIYDAKTFTKIGKFNFSNKEGWGLTTDGVSVIMSDGTNNLTYLDPDNFKVIKTLGVTENGNAAFYINELEYIKGFIYANVWTKNYILKIDSKNGNVIGKIDLSPLSDEVKSRDPRAMEMNGIAFDSITNKIYVTGKLWPSLIQIDFPH